MVRGGNQGGDSVSVHIPFASVTGVYFLIHFILSIRKPSQVNKTKQSSKRAPTVTWTCDEDMSHPLSEAAAALLRDAGPRRTGEADRVPSSPVRSR